MFGGKCWVENFVKKKRLVYVLSIRSSYVCVLFRVVGEGEELFCE